MKLREALDIKRGEIISLVGGGGKTTLMFALARELSASGSVITTTTTRILEPSPDETSLLLVEKEETLIIQRLLQKIEGYHHITLASERLASGKLKGVSPELVDRLAKLEPVSVIIVEADGAARRSLKAPGPGEPVIPHSTSLFIPVVGIDAIGLPLTEENVFRSEIAAQLLKMPVGEVTTVDAVAALITHPQGLLKDNPVHARIVPVINKVDRDKDLSQARDLATKILEMSYPRIEQVILSHAQSTKPVVEVISG